MRGSRLLGALFLAGPLLNPAWSIAQDNATIRGDIGTEFRFVTDERESAKFQEYRDLKTGVTADGWLLYQQDNGYFLDIRANEVGLDDQRYTISGGRYGSFKYTLGYDQIPHRFAFDARTLYSGVGTGTLTLSDRLQSDLQGTANGSAAQVGTLRDVFGGAHSIDLELMRKTGTANFDLMKFDPFFLRVEFSREHREGTRPFFGSFGFGNTVELPEPIDYDTTQLKIIGEYSKRPVHVNVTYYFSVFENNIDTLSFDNPFRAVDGTAANAYTLTSGSGPARGLIDLYPNNIAHTVSATGSLSDLPLRTRISLTASWGWRLQDDDFVPFTTNRAIATGAVSGVAGEPVPFDTFNRSNLPAKSADAKQTTALYNLLVTSRPLSFLNLKGRYRYFEYENTTRQIAFPGHVRTDAVWEPEPETTVPTEFRKHTFGLDAGFDVFRLATVTFGYGFENQQRTNREVEDQDEHSGKVSIDSRPFSWLTLRTSYERAERRGRYDPNTPFVATHLGDEPFEPTGIPQLPFLRKFDQADRNRDKVQFLATVYPIEPLSVTGSAAYAKDDFVNSPFGLREARTQTYSLDAEYAPNDRLSLFVFYTFEKIDSNQKSRQWSPGGVGDPFNTDTGLDSFSNWTADSEDIIHTVGGGVQIALIPKKLGLKLTYSFSKSNGKVDFGSPVGTAANDANAFVPVSYDNVDDIETHALKGQLQYRIWKGLSVAVGALWERFDISDFNNKGFTNIPTTAAGTYNGALLMNTLLKSYDTTVVFTKLSYAF